MDTAYHQIKPALEREARDRYHVCASQATALRFCRLNA